MRLRIHERREADHRIVVVNGELDHHSAPVLREKLLPTHFEPSAPHLVVDLAGLEFMDSAGLGLLVEAYKRNDHGGGSFALTGAPASVRRLLHVTGLGSVFRSYDSVEEALADKRPTP